MKVVKKIKWILTLIASIGLWVGCSSDDNYFAPEDLSPFELLSRTPWVTSDAVNQAGEKIALDDANVSNFVGYAYFKSDGSFTMYNLDDSPKMQGDWSVSADGKTRTLVAKNPAGEVLFTRVVDITVLNRNEFTYRIYPDEANKSVYYDIVHTPTTHQEPELNYNQLMTRTPWVTSDAVNQAGEKVALDNANVSNFVGYAYFKADGSFTMYNLDDSPKMEGDWSVSADGKTRTLVAKNPAGEVLFTRVVDITVLNKEEFTYRIYPDEADKSVYYDIVHTPTSHKEPELSYDQLMSRTPWVTSDAVNQAGEHIALDNANVSNFVGFAYFKADGSFTMYNLDDSPKMQGDWSVSQDGKTRTLVAKNAAGEILFTRVVDITVLNKVEFTYRIFPNEQDTSLYYDIIHTPSSHPEPKL